MSLKVRAVASDPSGARWHWSVYDDPDGDFVRNGSITGDHEEAERAARAAILLMGGTMREDDD